MTPMTPRLNPFAVAPAPMKLWLDFDQVAETLGREAAACRQLAARARTHVRASRPRFPVEKQRGMEIAAAFFTASRSGDMQTLRTLLADDVRIEADGGGKRPAATHPITGIEQVMKLHVGLARIFATWSAADVE